MTMDQDRIGFERLHALARQGYIAKLGRLHHDGGDDCLEMVHPRKNAKKNPASNLTLYSDGLVMPHDMRSGFAPEDAKEFASFLRSVKQPTLYDLHVRPIATKAQIIIPFYLSASSQPSCLSGLWGSFSRRKTATRGRLGY